MDFSVHLETIDLCVETQLAGGSGSATVPTLMGDPGVGKTRLVHEYAEWKKQRGSEYLGIDNPKVGVFTFILSQSDSIDFGAPVPNVAGGTLDFVVPQDILGKAPGMGEYDIVIIFFDELPNASPATLSSVQSYLEDGVLHGQPKASNVVFVAAGNLPENNCGARPLPMSFTTSRLVIIPVESDSDGWLKWAEENGIDPRIQTVISIRPDLLNRFNPKEKSKAQAVPRSYEKLSNLIKLNPSEDSMLQVGQGTIGDTWIEVGAYFRFGKEIPHVQDILDNPSSAHIPGEVDPSVSASGQHAIVGNLARFLAEKKDKEETLLMSESNAICIYLRRLPGEVTVFGAKLCAQQHSDFVNCKEYTRLTVDYQVLESYGVN